MVISSQKADHQSRVDECFRISSSENNLPSYSQHKLHNMPASAVMNVYTNGLRCVHKQWDDT